MSLFFECLEDLLTDLDEARGGLTNDVFYSTPQGKLPQFKGECPREVDNLKGISKDKLDKEKKKKKEVKEAMAPNTGGVVNAPAGPACGNCSKPEPEDLKGISRNEIDKKKKKKKKEIEEEGGTATTAVAINPSRETIKPIKRKAPSK